MDTVSTSWLARASRVDHEAISSATTVLDQQLALKWVQSNIAEFAATRTTSLGGSPGAPTRPQHVSPWPRLLHRVICQSYCPHASPEVLGELPTPSAGIAFSVAAAVAQHDAATPQSGGLTSTQVETIAEGNFIGGKAS